jgi:hypothetical protein
MNPNVLTATSGAGAVVTAVAALIANHRAFGILDRGISDQSKRIDIMAQDFQNAR